MIWQKNKLRKRESRGLAGPLFAVFLAIFAGFLTVSNLKIKERRQEVLQKIEVLGLQVEQLRRENSQFKEKLSQQESPEFIEREAREKYNLKKPGEEVAVIIREKAPPLPAEPVAKTFWQKILEFFGRGQ